MSVSRIPRNQQFILKCQFQYFHVYLCSSIHLVLIFYGFILLIYLQNCYLISMHRACSGQKKYWKVLKHEEIFFTLKFSEVIFSTRSCWVLKDSIHGLENAKFVSTSSECSMLTYLKVYSISIIIYKKTFEEQRE